VIYHKLLTLTKHQYLRTPTKFCNLTDEYFDLVEPAFHFKFLIKYLMSIPLHFCLVCLYAWTFKLYILAQHSYLSIHTGLNNLDNAF